MIKLNSLKRFILKNKKSFYRIYYKISSRKLKTKDFTILSSNCLAGRIYKDLGVKYNTPTVGLFFWGEDFLKFIKNLDKYLSVELKFNKESKYDEINEMRKNNNLNYPIGILDDIEIQFLHYKSCNEAMDKWKRRCSRVNRNKIFILDTDRDGFNIDFFNSYEKINFPKLIFTSKDYKNKYNIFVKEFEGSPYVGDLYNSAIFYKYINPIKWINNN